MDQEVEYDDIISEGAEYSPKSEFSKAIRVDHAVRLCVEARGDEMKEGYFNHSIDKSGNEKKMWIKDTRQVFVGRVIALLYLLNPEINLKDSQEIKKRINSVKEDIDKLWDEFSYLERKFAKDKEGNFSWVLTGRKIMPHYNNEVIVVDPITSQGKMRAGGWDVKIHAYWDGCVPYYDLLFAILNDLINDLNYFKPGMSF